MECVKIWFGLKTVGWLWFMLSAGHSRSHTKEILPFECSSANFRLCTVENSGRSPGQLCAGRAIIRWEGWSLHRHLCVLLSFLEWHLALSLSSFRSTKKLSCIHFTSLAIGCETKAKLSLREILLSFGICFNFWFAGKDRIGSSWRCQDKAPKGAIWSILHPSAFGRLLGCCSTAVMGSKLGCAFSAWNYGGYLWCPIGNSGGRSGNSWHWEEGWAGRPKWYLLGQHVHVLCNDWVWAVSAGVC